MTDRKAEDYREFFFEAYRQFHEWQQGLVEATNFYGLSESSLVKLTRHYDKNVYTHAMNFPIQSSAWEVLALAIRYVDEHATGGIHISHHVYDELILLTPQDKVLDAARLLRDAFYQGFRTCFPGGPDRGLVEIGIGNTWEEAGLEPSIVSFEWAPTAQ